MIFIIFIGIVMIVVIILSYLYSVIKSDSKQAWKELQEIEQKIKQKITELESLNTQVEHRKIDTSVNLTKAQINVLNEYERSNIRIPKDIIEDLPTWNNLFEDDIKNYIENQRQYWKLENSKKPFTKAGINQ